jgi:hypothetical protein
MRRKPRIDELWIEQDGPRNWRAGIDGPRVCLMEWFESDTGELDAVAWLCDRLIALGYVKLPRPITIEAAHGTVQ